MIVEKKLKNEIPVLFEKIDSVKSVTIGIFVKTGSKHECEKDAGVSHLLEHMMFKGTKTRTAKQISEEIEDIGGAINAYTGKELTGYYVQLLSTKLKYGIDILADMFLNSTFTQENLDREKKVVIEEINMYEDIPEEKIHEINATVAISGKQSNSILGSIHSLNAIKRSDLVKYFNNRYSTDNIVISLAGNMDIDEVNNNLNSTFGLLTKNRKIENDCFDFNINNKNKIVKQNSNQVHICVNSKGVSIIDKDKYKFSILSNILAGNMSSRLFQKVRENRGLAYSIYSYLSTFKEGGIFTIYAGTTKKNYKEVIELILYEFEEIKKNGVTEKELERSKNQFLSSLTFGLESSKSRMSQMASSYINYNRIRSDNEIIDSILKITTKEIQEIAKTNLLKKYYSYTVLGDVK